MLKKFLTKVVGDPNEKELKRLQPLVEEINGLEERFTRMDNDEFNGMTQQFRQRIIGETTELREALAAAEGEYASFAGTDEQRFARIEVERIRKELLDEEAGDSRRNDAGGVRGGARGGPAHDRPAAL